MSVNKITRYPLKRLNGLSTLNVPVGSAPVSVVSLDSTHEVVHIQMLEPVPQEGEELEYEEIELLSIQDDLPFSDPGDDKELHYIGSAVWDRGHRINHVFEVAYATKYEPVYPQIPDNSFENFAPVAPPEISEESFDALVAEFEEQED